MRVDVDKLISAAKSFDLVSKDVHSLDDYRAIPSLMRETRLLSAASLCNSSCFITLAADVHMTVVELIILVGQS